MEALNVHDYETLAHERLDELAWEYFRGGAGDESTLRENASAFARDGLEKPLTLRTYCSAAARTSCSVAGGSKLKSVWILRHMLSPRLGFLTGN